ncbi:DMT family transporter [Brevirhabdus sp.]|uniref:DMT family transporter n=1 Tax=Brevirhabdus sp. TaxID=2004514 RepID=UPI00405892EE
MRLFLATALTMTAFAANSVLNRMALVDGRIGAGDFAVWRVASGAAVLLFLVVLRDGRIAIGGGRGRWAGVLSLSVYMVGFSLAYLSLDAGAGALILFGGVQVTMFGGAVALGEPLPARRWLGAALAFCGLVWLLWPGSGAGGADAFPAAAVLAMAAAAIGWGIYSLVGRAAADPLQSTAANFLLASPLCWAALWLLPPMPAPGGGEIGASAGGIALALVSGVVTSGLGYALWYTVLPRLAASVASVAQLSVPVIAMAGGVVFLEEVPGWRFGVAALVVLGGVAIASIAPRSGRRAGQRSGSQRADQRSSGSSGS